VEKLFQRNGILTENNRSTPGLGASEESGTMFSEQ
jgi:hypothetical protein